MFKNHSRNQTNWFAVFHIALNSFQSQHMYLWPIWDVNSKLHGEIHDPHPHPQYLTKIYRLWEITKVRLLFGIDSQCPSNIGLWIEGRNFSRLRHAMPKDSFTKTLIIYHGLSKLWSEITIQIIQQCPKYRAFILKCAKLLHISRTIVSISLKI